MILYETLSQPLIFVYALLIGFASGVVFDIANYIVFLCAKNKAIKFIAQMVATLIAGIVFLWFLINFSYGQLRAFILIAFVIALIFERIILGKPLALLISWCYNKFEKIIVAINKKVRRKSDEHTGDKSN